MILTPGIATASAVIERAIAYAVPSAHLGFAGLDVFIGLSPKLVLIWAHHADPQLMKDLQSGIVARRSELPLELNGRSVDGCDNRIGTEGTRKRDAVALQNVADQTQAIHTL